MPERRNLRYKTAQDVIDDVEMLQAKPHDRCGSWSLSQACYHLDKATRRALQPVPHTPNTPEQDERAKNLPGVLQGGKLPGGIKGPDDIMPGPEVGDDAIASFLATMREFAGAKQIHENHRVFGNMTQDQMRELTLIHAAHHLSHFVPKGDR
jgi:hypothetical protein